MPFEAKELKEHAETFRGVYEVAVHHAKHAEVQEVPCIPVPPFLNVIANIYAGVMCGICMRGFLFVACFWIGCMALAMCL